jgi:DNA-binding beta-propeller fold protein YncE
LPLTFKSVATWGRSGGFGGAGIGPDEYDHPSGIALSRDETEIYVRDSGNARVKVVDRAGNYLREWLVGGDSLCSGSGGANALAVGITGTIFSVRSYEHEVVGWSANGDILSIWQIPDALDFCEFYHSHGIEVDSGGQVYLCETQSAAIIVFSPGGDVVRRFGSRGSGKGQFELFPDSVALADGHVYVTAFEELFSFSSKDGSFQYYVQPPETGTWRFLETASAASEDWFYFARREDPPSIYAIPPRYSKVTHKHSFDVGILPGQVTTPWDFAIASDGLWYVTEYDSSRVQVFAGPDRTWPARGR